MEPSEGTITALRTHRLVWPYSMAISQSTCISGAAHWTWVSTVPVFRVACTDMHRLLRCHEHTCPHQSCWLEDILNLHVIGFVVHPNRLFLSIPRRRTIRMRELTPSALRQRMGASEAPHSRKKSEVWIVESLSKQARRCMERLSEQSNAIITRAYDQVRSIA